jgi:VCBS repeat-containing protein
VSVPKVLESDESFVIGATDIHDFNINIPKPSGDAHIVVQKTSNLALVNTYTFNSATSTYTLYVGSDFHQIAVSYDHAATGNATFTVDNITYSAGTKIPSTDLLFDVTAVDGDGDTSTTSLQVDLLGVTSVASALTLSGTPQLVTTTVNGTNDAAIIFGATTGSVIEAGGVRQRHARYRERHAHRHRRRRSVRYFHGS